MSVSASIAAIATPSAPSALGIIRCSGALCAKLAGTSASTQPLLSPFSSPLQPRVASLRNYIALDHSLLDQVVATYYEDGRSFTGEPSLEISCHGNPFILQKILTDLLARGFALAEPGDFTRRAFLNGKLDLTQAEAIGSVIAAHSDRALAAAHRQLAGELGNAIRGFADNLLSLIASVEATIDFPEEDVPVHLPAVERFNDLIAEVSMLRSTQRSHDLTFEGARVALVGAPNAGKSSLFNALVGHDRAIVSPIAGTTRDYLSAQITLGGHLLTLIDTAGCLPTEEPASTQDIQAQRETLLKENPQAYLESLGVARTYEQLSTADIVIFVFDGVEPDLSPLPLLGRHHPFGLIIAANKADLPGFSVPDLADPYYSAYVPPASMNAIPVSATTGAGLEELRAQLTTVLTALMPEADTLMVSARHAAALDQCLEQLYAARELLLKNTTQTKTSALAGESTIIAHHLHSALNFLGEILGRFDNEQVLDKLFSQFCIGK